jgi:hypothetical protein
MDFSNRNVQSQAPAPGAQSTAASSSGGGKRNKSDNTRWGRIGVVAAIVVIVVLLLGLIAIITFGGAKEEGKYVDTKRLQAVFLNTGQVYFGNVKSLNNKYFVLTNIYYLQTANSGTSGSTSNANTNVSLVKLGCELHEPFDQMLINRDQVTFWENLQDNGQVAKAVASFEKANPNGQKCADQSSAASTNSSNSAQNAGSSNSNSTTQTNTNTNNTTTAPKTTP